MIRCKGIDTSPVQHISTFNGMQRQDKALAPECLILLTETRMGPMIDLEHFAASGFPI